MLPRASSVQIEQVEGLPDGIALYLCRFTSEGRKEQSSGERREQLNRGRELVLHLIQEALSLPSPPELAHHPSGAPFLPQHPEKSISISHAAGVVAVLLAPSTYRLGVDVERRRPQLLRVQTKYLHDDELPMLLPCIPDELTALTLLWSAKEALFKLLQPPSQSLLDFRLRDFSLLPSPLGRIGPFPSASHPALRGSYCPSLATPAQSSPSDFRPISSGLLTFEASSSSSRLVPLSFNLYDDFLLTYCWTRE
jgi:hypothetical protein